MERGGCWGFVSVPLLWRWAISPNHEGLRRVMVRVIMAEAMMPAMTLRLLLPTKGWRLAEGL